MESLRLTKLTVAGFRGFNLEQTIPLDAEFVLIRGENGSGKSSAIDAMSWLFTGEVGYIANRSTGLKVESDPLVNCYSDGAARVSVELRDEHGNSLVITRIGNSRTSTLSAEQSARGSAALTHLCEIASKSPEQLAHRVHRWGILSQSTMTDAIESGGVELHDRLANLLGLDEITRFVDAVSTFANSAKANRDSCKERLEASLERFEESEKSVTTLSERMKSPETRTTDRTRAAQVISNQLADGWEIRKTAIEDENEFFTVLREELSSVIAALVRVRSGRADFETNAVTSEEVASATLITKELEKSVFELNNLRTQNDKYRSLFELAVDLLSDECPVCEQEIDEGHVHESIESRLGGLDASAEALENLEANISETRLALSRLNEKLRAAEEARIRFQSSVSELESILSALQVLSPPPSRDANDVSEAQIAMLSNARDVCDEVRIQFVARMDASVVRSMSELKQLQQQQIGTEREELRTAEERLSEAKQLQQRAIVAKDAVISQALADIQPTFSEVFDRMLPHPTFTKLLSSRSVRYKKERVNPLVVDDLEGINANPTLIYSEGQINVVAISYFLGLALSTEDDALPFVVLDDPVQSMDVIGMLGFADLFRRLRRNKQLIVATHDSRFASILRRKLAPREQSVRCLDVSFSSWSRTGPVISSNYVSPTEIAPLLKSVA